MIKAFFIILTVAGSITAAGIVPSKDSLKIYNNPVSSFADEILLINGTDAAVNLDSAFLEIEVMDTTGSGEFGGLGNRFHLQWKRMRPLRFDLWSLKNISADIYRLSPAASSSSIRPSLDFSAPGESLSVGFVEIGTCLGCSGVPTWYPPYIKGKFFLYFSNRQTLEIRLYSEDLRKPLVADQPCTNYSCDSMNVRKILDRNGMESVPVSEVANVASGRIAGLQLSFVPGGAVTLPKPITILPAEIGNLTALTSIMASGNKIDSISPRIGRCNKLTTLLAGNCGITELPDSIVQCSRLSLVFLDGNLLTRLPDSIGKLKSIGMMDITRNRLISLPESMAKMDSMDCIFIAGNRICTLPPAVITWLGNIRAQMHCQQFEPVWPDSQDCTAVAALTQRDAVVSPLPVVRMLTGGKFISVNFEATRIHITSVVVINLAGKTVKQLNRCGGSGITLPIDGLARGVYTVALFSGTTIAGVRQVLIDQ